jgi:pimeloyl-ACP methyl ester carboxylesterase
MRLARLVVAGLALGAAIGFLGALVRPRSVHNATLAATIGVGAVGAVGNAEPSGAQPGPMAATSGDASTTITRSLGVPALTGSGGAC